jgi:hypothetical protein
VDEKEEEAKEKAESMGESLEGSSRFGEEEEEEAQAKGQSEAKAQAKELEQAEAEVTWRVTRRLLPTMSNRQMTKVWVSGRKRRRSERANRSHWASHLKSGSLCRVA